MATGTITVKQIINAIAGNSSVTKGAAGLIYSVTPVPDAIKYTWTVPDDWSITDGQGTDSIMVTAGTTEGHAGTITVKASNGSCIGTSTLNVSVGCPVRTTGGNWITFMCHNLGADENMSIADQMAYVSKDNLDETVYGSLYQWGRQADGHQLRTSQAYPTDDASSESGVVSSPNLDGNGQVVSTFEAYGKFIKTNGAPNDWRSPQDDTLWYANNNKTANDPCPDGWRVPTTYEWIAILNGDGMAVSSIPAAGITCASGNTWVVSNTTNTRGWLVTPQGNSTATLFLPFTGYRNSNAEVFNTNTQGSYWTNTTVAPNTSAIYVYTNYTTVAPYYGNPRVTGSSVRCVLI